MMIAYFDCFSGISGDMTLGALMDLGVPSDFIKESIKDHLIERFDLRVKETVVNGIKATDLEVVYNEKDHGKRDYRDIRKLIEESGLSDSVKSNALSMFFKIAEAESKIHGTNIDKTHFHEVGSVDAIIDIAGVCLGIDYLNIDRVYSSPLAVGSGFVKCSHGTLPVPAPATLEILKGVPLKDSEIRSELVTPTGAAIIKTLSDGFGPLNMTPLKIGYGSGKKRFEGQPNLLRIVTGEDSLHSGNSVYVIETVIDDMNPEIFGYLMEILFEEGVLDLYYSPVYMKKNRPGTHLTALAAEDKKDKIVEVILSETTSTGVRISHTQRITLEREEIQIETSFGKIFFKKIIKPDGKTVFTPEYEECRRVARERNLPLKIVYDELVKESDRLL